jgi:FMN phosphatase YigB (HAD superfamily)
MRRGKVCICVDFDGVIARSERQGKAVLEALAQSCKVPAHRMRSAFFSVGTPYILGRASPAQFMRSLSQKLGKPLTRGELDGAYQMVRLNRPLLRQIAAWQGQGVRVMLVTNNPSYRFRSLARQGIIDVWRVFDAVHHSGKYHCRKDAFFRRLIRENKRIIFIDNNPSFLRKVRDAGGVGISYEGGPVVNLKRCR